MNVVLTTWRISGMYCPHCETAIQRALGDLDGIREAKADHRAGTLTAYWDAQTLPEEQLAERIAEAGYSLERSRPTHRGRRLRGLVVLATMGLLFVLLSVTPLQALLSAFPTARAGMSLGALFTVGLLTSLHCVGMCGGINLAQSVGSVQAGRKASVANIQYNLGRVISYTAIGGVIGALGSVFKMSTALQAAIQVVAAVLMLLMALNMLDVGGVQGLLPILPGGLRAKLLSGRRNSSLWIGLVNGLMPCGPLQAMQLYALSTGSWWMGALSMLCFSLGTVPLMLSFGLVSGHLNKRFGKPMRLISGALVLVMGMAMLTNGMALAGIRLNIPTTFGGESSIGNGGVQELRSELDWRGYPDISVKAGVPVHWVIHAEASKITGCNNEIVIPALKLRVPLEPGDNVIEFTADEPGVIPYTCWMGMLRGTITVEE